MTSICILIISLFAWRLVRLGLLLKEAWEINRIVEQSIKEIDGEI